MQLSDGIMKITGKIMLFNLCVSKKMYQIKFLFSNIW